MQLKEQLCEQYFRVIYLWIFVFELIAEPVMFPYKQSVKCDQHWLDISS